MTTATLEAPVTTATQPILQRSVCLLLSCGALGNHRKVELRSVDVRTDGESLARAAVDELGARKRLFAEADLRPVRSVIASAKHYVRSMALDGGSRMFGPGAHLVPILSVGAVDARLAQFQDDLVDPVEALVNRLPALIEERRATLGPKLFDIGDYPTPQRVRDAFRIDWSYVSFGAPDRLQEVDAAAYARAKAQWDGQLADAYSDVVLGLRESAALVMRELAERLAPSEDGKPKVLRATALRDLQDLLEKLPVLNSVGQDDKLPGIIARVGAMAEGLDVETLKKAPAIRGMLLAEAAKAAETLDALVSSGRRAMALGNAPF